MSDPAPRAALVEQYMRGECHIHAIAAVRQHGGHFAICYDDSEAYFEDEDSHVSCVVHVWSVHQTAGGLVARDVLGDIPCEREAMEVHIAAFFPDLAVKIRFGDVRIDERATLDEVMHLSGDEDHQPLFGVDEHDLAEAAMVASVTRQPGEADQAHPEADLCF